MEGMLKRQGICYFFFYCLITWGIMCFGKGFPHSESTWITENENGNHSEEAINRLLHIFGMDQNITPQTRHQPSPPQYMLELYRTFREAPNMANNPLYGRANTVRSFADKGDSEDEAHCIFEVADTIPDHEEIVRAEFHIFTHRNPHRHHSSLHISQLLLYKGSSNKNENLVEARIINKHNTGWEVFNITSIVKEWRENSESDYGFSVRILDSYGREWSSRRVRRLQRYRKPLLIIFSHDSKISTSRSVYYQKDGKSFEPERNIQNVPSVNAGKNTISDFENTNNSVRSERSAGIEEGSCMRHELRVDFERLGWSTWIISPKWYDAYVCSGACSFPLGQNQRPTNHATVQSIVHELGLTPGIGVPCCVPTELYPVNLLYFDSNMNVVLKQYDDMVAAACGCQ